MPAFLPTISMSSTILHEKPHSLSYHAKIFTKLLFSPSTRVNPASNTDEYVLCNTSLLTIGSSVYCKMPLIGPSAAAFMAALISSLVTSLLNKQVKSTSDTSGVGTRSATPFILPLQLGRTKPIAFAAPVLVGMMLTGARPFVVQLALLRMLCFSGSYLSLFTPRTTVKSGFSAGALMSTFFAPAAKCLDAPSRLVKKPVDSTARKTPRSFHGNAAGSFWLRHLRSFPSTTRSLPWTSTVPGNRP